MILREYSILEKLFFGHKKTIIEKIIKLFRKGLDAVPVVGLLTAIFIVCELDDFLTF